MRRIIAPILLAAFAAIIACAAPRAEKPGEIQIIDFAAASAMLKKEKVVFIDNRPPAKFRQGHIPGAVNMPYFAPGAQENEMPKDELVALTKNKEVVFYCTGYLRAYHAAKRAIELGVPQEQIFWYKGGFSEWQQKNKEAENVR